MINRIMEEEVLVTDDHHQETLGGYAEAAFEQVKD